MGSLKVVLLFSIIPVVFSKSFFADFVKGKGPYKEDDANRFLGKLNELNRIQADILQVPITSNDQLTNQTVELDGSIQTKPEETPYLFEGDMVLTDDQIDQIIRNVKDQYWARQSKAGKLLYAIRGKRSMTSNLALRWTFPIPFYINTATGVDQNAVLAGVQKWEQDTCARFTQLSSLPNSGNAVEFIQGSGCWSYIGKVGYSSQQISIGVGCTSLGTVTHEIGHALGFYHEQARYDRDNYVTILTQNIQSTYLGQFTKQSFSSMVDYGVGYDYGSVMHYDQAAFSSNGGNTIATIDPNYQATIGQRLEPSFADVKRINLAYCNSSCTNTLVCQNGGYTDPNNCAACRCPPGFGGQLCNVAGSGSNGCGAGDLTATNNIQTISASGSLNCNYVITAPVGTKVYFQMVSAAFSRSVPCTANYLEIKYDQDFTRVGARFCTSYPTISLSESNRLVVIYKGQQGTAFSLNYRYDPQDFTTTSTSPQTTATPATQATTTPAPRTTATTASTTTTQTTTTAATTTTTQAPTTTASSVCQAWSSCSAQCGGCGTKSRRCATYTETVYCNTNPCSGSYCCRPFFYVTQYGTGFCRRPQLDESIQQQQNEETYEKAIHPQNDGPVDTWDNIEDHPKSRVVSNKGFAITN